ncbi:uncharacterized protein LOC124964790 [Sciurus carolinensis]|uniref:uncharacterized protein LOC124964790 n=1 Tax=Sciurus carolinensis TaxID=30640 RepID=UPI001FB51476|nr:uncharacterized protein LOC124964790 [Sciurus carolinensis]
MPPLCHLPTLLRLPRKPAAELAVDSTASRLFRPAFFLCQASCQQRPATGPSAQTCCVTRSEEAVPLGFSFFPQEFLAGTPLPPDARVESGPWGWGLQVPASREAEATFLEGPEEEDPRLTTSPPSALAWAGQGASAPAGPDLVCRHFFCFSSLGTRKALCAREGPTLCQAPGLAPAHRPRTLKPQHVAVGSDAPAGSGGPADLRAWGGDCISPWRSASVPLNTDFAARSLRHRERRSKSHAGRARAGTWASGWRTRSLEGGRDRLHPGVLRRLPAPRRAAATAGRPARAPSPATASRTAAHTPLTPPREHLWAHVHLCRPAQLHTCTRICTHADTRVCWGVVVDRPTLDARRPVGLLCPSRLLPPGGYRTHSLWNQRPARSRGPGVGARGSAGSWGDLGL